MIKHDMMIGQKYQEVNIYRQRKLLREDDISDLALALNRHIPEFTLETSLPK